PPSGRASESASGCRCLQRPSCSYRPVIEHRLHPLLIAEETMRILDYTGRALGAICGALVSMLWMLGVWLPESGMALTGINFVVAMLMALLGLFAVIASVRGHAAVLFVAFVA